MIPHNLLLKRTVPLLVQCAEAHRKPRWLPVAKSKIYRIPKRPVLSQEERLELQRINNNYKTQMRAIRRFYHEEMIKEKSTRDSASSEMSQRLEADDWARCLELNEKWNSAIAIEREQRRKIQLEKMESYILARMERKDKELREQIEKASLEIKKQKELSATFITIEKLDEAIDYAIANPTDYNFAIDLQGNQLLGRENNAPQGKEESKTSTSV